MVDAFGGADITMSESVKNAYNLIELDYKVQNNYWSMDETRT